MFESKPLLHHSPMDNDDTKPSHQSLLDDDYTYEPSMGEEIDTNSKDFKQPPRSGFLSTMSNVTKCFIGAASFELPRAFEQAGVIGSVVGIVFLAITSSFSLQRLAACSKLLPSELRHSGENLTYPSLGQSAFGWWGWAVSWFGVVAMTLGVCGSYFVFIASTMASITNYSQTEWLLLTLVTVVILSWLRHLSHLAFTSAFGIAALVMAVSVTCYDASQQHNHKGLNDLPMWELETYPLFLGNAGFLYLISTAVLPLAQNMQAISPDKKYSNLIPDGHHSPYGSGIDPSFSNAFNSSVLFVTILNLTFGLYAWKQYGECHGDDDDECVQSNVIDNLGNGDLAKWVKVLLCVDLLFTTLVFLFPVNEVIEQEYFGAEVIARLNLSTAVSSDSSFSSLCGNLTSVLEWKRNLSRTFLAIAVATIAYLVPSFSLLTGLTGGFGNNILGFILPPLFYYKLQLNNGYWTDGRTGERRKVPEQCFLLFVFLFGIAFMFLSTYSFVAAIVKQDE